MVEELTELHVHVRRVLGADQNYHHDGVGHHEKHDDLDDHENGHDNDGDT